MKPVAFYHRLEQEYYCESCFNTKLTEVDRENFGLFDLQSDPAVYYYEPLGHRCTFCGKRWNSK